MTPLDFAAGHPVVALFLVVAAGWSLGEVFAAPITAWRKFSRRADCPRCHGTGREP